MRDQFRTGLRGRQIANQLSRAHGREPAPGLFAGVKRCARWLKRAGSPGYVLPNRKLRYMHKSARDRLLLNPENWRLVR